MSCISEEVAQAEDVTAGRRATLLLKLQDAQRDLARLTASRNAALERATACRALAALSTTPPLCATCSALRPTGMRSGS